MTTLDDKQNVNTSGGKKETRTNNGPYKVDVFTAFLEWSVLTTKEKKKLCILTAKDFSIQYKIHESQLSRWKARDDFKQAKIKLQRSKWGDLTPDVVEGLYKRCVRYGTASDVELWLAYVEGWNRKQELKELKEVTLGPNDIRSLTEFLPEEEQKKFYDTLIDLIAKAEVSRALENRA